ncbi:unnamed protein product [Cuscuta campestris]|uniref:Riboflavin kinase n=1 Tax=Cuscuta campestris TaxID=132261 RepID=A0A484M551_9ASTE|nr:unnamed protein product [Cuscuta campestris]VFQ83965.1 unnamed protein product [Cuscuta campestris]
MAATWSLLSPLPVHGGKGKKPLGAGVCRGILSLRFLRCPKPVHKRLLWANRTLGRFPIRSQVMQTPSMDKMVESDVERRSWPPENRVDSPAIHNPLVRHERLGCGWLAAVFEWEGVLIEDNPDLEREAWLALSREEGKPPPPAFILRRIEGMKNEQAISEVLCWSRDSLETKRMSARKEEIYQALHCGTHRFRSGSHEFINALTQHNIPMALVSTRPRVAVEAAVRSAGIEKERPFDAVVASEDVHRGKPDPEMFIYAARLLGIVPQRCIVFGNSNLTVEAAHDARMRCVAVASKHLVYELGAADLVVKRLDELSVVDLKNLVAKMDEFEVEVEEEDDEPYRSSAVGVADIW